MASAWPQIPSAIQDIVDRVQTTKCQWTHTCRLSCFCTGSRYDCGKFQRYRYGPPHYYGNYGNNDGPMYDYLGSYHALTCGVMEGRRCGGHPCGGTCDVEAKKLLTDLVETCRTEVVEESDLSHIKFVLEELVVSKLAKVVNQFLLRCTRSQTCSIIHLGCSNGRYCLELQRRPHMVPNHGSDHNSSCPLVLRPPKADCGQQHVCNSPSPNLDLMGELLELKKQVVKLLQAPFAPCVLPDVWPDDSATLCHREGCGLMQFSDDGSVQISASELAESDNASGQSRASVQSFLSGDGGPHCFLPNVLFCTGARPTFYMIAQDLRKGSQVLSADGEKMLEVTSIEAHLTSKLLVLHIEGCPPFTTTPTHRIMVPMYGAEPQAVKAEDLKAGSFVLCTKSMAQKVSLITTLCCEEREVLAIAFKPDEPVAVFSAPSSMVMTKGLKVRATRRSGMNQRAINPQPDLSEQSSAFLGTTPGEYSD
ncbi:unnamed protein product [Polarella glacialis]|uniref:Uncharacterized protein n=1 Tax=Polarella glacialis TaxID=89957 RepID=A0A813GRH4_POLGL|nr:unnamed protein product [Polarella glacialis]CAE8627612.1 unnamed protein product [Polarella glacialis]